MLFLGGIVYVLNPFATFFVGCYTIVTNHYIEEHYNYTQEQCASIPNPPSYYSCCNVETGEYCSPDYEYFPLFWEGGPDANAKVHALTQIGQALFFLILTILIEKCRA